jgi:hypothetical protein
VLVSPLRRSPPCFSEDMPPMHGSRVGVQLTLLAHLRALLGNRCVMTHALRGIRKNCRAALGIAVPPGSTFAPVWRCDAGNDQIGR